MVTEAEGGGKKIHYLHILALPLAQVVGAVLVESAAEAVPVPEGSVELEGRVELDVKGLLVRMWHAGFIFAA
jgi:hypothetical protein